MNVVMIGTGYVGLVSGTCLAEFGASVACLDIDRDKIGRLERGEIPLYEPGLTELVEKNTASGRLRFTYSYEDVIGDADLVFIAVGTPMGDGGGRADLSYVHQAARSLAPHLSGYTVVVDKSTVPVGTAREIRRLIADQNPHADFDVASNPEFLREGAAVFDFMQPDRVILGVDSERASRLLQELYRPHMLATPIIITDLESAELIKYASNAFLAAKISFINEMSMLCEAVGADIQAVAEGMGLDSRIGYKFLQTGPGFGGSCFPKDTRALLHEEEKAGLPGNIIRAVIELNEVQMLRMADKIREALGGDVSGRRMAILGLTFKPGTDDMRDAPSLVILPRLLAYGAEIHAHDPRGMEEARKLLPDGIVYHDTIHDCLTDADAVVLMTEWHEYRDLNFVKIRSLTRSGIFVDLRNIYDPARMKKAGFDYYCIGRPANRGVDADKAK
jgi:UDPglucose 6-dehydrogenase